VLLIFFRFIGFIFRFGIKYWYIVIPLMIIFYLFRKKKRKDNINGLDPDKEIKLKEKPIIEDDE